jgi:hypothetical protein
MSLTRKEFLRSVVTVTAGAAGAALVVACGGDSGSDAATRSCAMNGTTSDIGSNHGHVLMVTKDEVNAAVEKSYNITGTATHAHNVTVTVAMFTMLKSNTSVMTTSTGGGTDGHTHSITIMCV